MIDDMSEQQIKISRQTSLIFFLLLFTFSLCAMNAAAQDEIPANAASPPIKAIPKEDKARLEAETDVKKRLTLALEMIEIRLKTAENLNDEGAFAEMFTQLGIFHALIDNTLNFLERNNIGSGKILNYYKRFELSLRGFLSRLEIIRRNLPLRYEYYVRNLVKAVRDARTRAVEPLFGDTVLPNQFSR